MHPLKIWNEKHYAITVIITRLTNIPLLVPEEGQYAWTLWIKLGRNHRGKIQLDLIHPVTSERGWKWIQGVQPVVSFEHVLCHYVTMSCDISGEHRKTRRAQLHTFAACVDVTLVWCEPFGWTSVPPRLVPNFLSNLGRKKWSSCPTAPTLPWRLWALWPMLVDKVNATSSAAFNSACLQKITDLKMPMSLKGTRAPHLRW